MVSDAARGSCEIGKVRSRGEDFANATAKAILCAATGFLAKSQLTLSLMTSQPELYRNGRNARSSIYSLADTICDVVARPVL